MAIYYFAIHVNDICQVLSVSNTKCCHSKKKKKKGLLYGHSSASVEVEVI